MSDLLIEQFCQMLAERLEENGSVSQPESIAFLQSVIQADARLRTVFEDRMVQFNQGNAVGFQTWLESGAKGFFGTNYVVHDPAVLREGMRTLLDELAKRPVGTPSNLPLSGVVKFVGREENLAQVHGALQAGSTVAVTSVSGMGGVGKTELALQYAYQHLQSNTYPGGLCWINVRAQDVGLGLLEFARTQLGLPEPPDILETLLEKVQWVCRRWQGEPILVVLDDVTDYEVVDPYLNLLDPRFRVLMTTRLKLRAKAEQLELRVLTESASLELLRVLVDDPHRIDSQLADAQRLCEWLGYLPLGLELVGRYLTEDEDISLEEMLDLLLQERLAAEALLEAYPEMTASLGVATAFELSWKELTDEAKKLCGLLSIFALAPIPWNLVERCVPDWEKKQLKQCRDRQLKKRSLLSRVGQELYQLHQLIREFFAVKRERMADIDVMKQTFCRVMVMEVQTIPQTLTIKQIQQIAPIISHLAEAATNLTDSLADADLIMPFIGIARFYTEQADYAEALPWLQRACAVVKARRGTEHFDLAVIYQHLAGCYRSQGHYTDAIQLHIEAINILILQQNPENNLGAAASFNSLGLLYNSQGHYIKAESSYSQALIIREKYLGSDHPQVATTLHNLARLYENQRHYDKAEPLHKRALNINEKSLGEAHPDVALNLNGLGKLYYHQKRYDEAEALLKKALSIREKQLGADHLDVAQSLNDLGNLYVAKASCDEAEVFLIRALNIQEQKLGSEHPYLSIGFFNLAVLYDKQKRYSEAGMLYYKATDISNSSFGPDHPQTQRFSMTFSNFLVEVVQAGKSAQLPKDPIIQELLQHIQEGNIDA